MTLLHGYFATFTLILRLSSCSRIKAVTLTPSNPTKDGANISCTHSDCTVHNNEWNITSSDYIGFHLQIDLDGSWGFHPDQVSTISLTMHGTSVMDVNTDLDALFVFSVNSAQYITHWLSFDQKYSNTIYPARGKYTTCDAESGSKTPLASGNIKACVCDPTCYKATDRGRKATGGDLWGFMSPKNYPDRLNAWPMTIRITNNPIKHRTVTALTTPTWKEWTQGCAYNQSFRAEYGLQIYIATEDIGETIAFTQFELMYEYETNGSSGNDEDQEWYKALIIQLIPYLIITLAVCTFILCIICLVRIAHTKRHKDAIESVSDTSHSAAKETVPISAHDDDNQGVRHWLQDIGLPQYFATFIDNGYDSMRHIEAIQSREDLKTIGVRMLAHQMQIMTHIKKLLDQSDHNDDEYDELQRSTKVEHHSDDAKEQVDKYKRAQFVMASGYNQAAVSNDDIAAESLWLPNSVNLYTDVGNSWMAPAGQIDGADDDFLDINTAGFIG